MIQVKDFFQRIEDLENHYGDSVKKHHWGMSSGSDHWTVPNALKSDLKELLKLFIAPYQDVFDTFGREKIDKVEALTSLSSDLSRLKRTFAKSHSFICNHAIYSKGLNLETWNNENRTNYNFFDIASFWLPVDRDFQERFNRSFPWENKIEQLGSSCSLKLDLSNRTFQFHSNKSRSLLIDISCPKQLKAFLNDWFQRVGGLYADVAPALADMGQWHFSHSEPGASI